MLNEDNKRRILEAAQEMRGWAESLETLVEMGRGVKSVVSVAGILLRRNTTGTTK